MDASGAIDVASQAVVTAAVLVAPALAVALLVGCLTSVLQAVTQVQDQTISFVPKLFAVAAAVMVCLPWMLDYFVQYAREVIMHIPQTLGGG
jgi:flagellar biosynthetic protein FliQ